MRSPEVFATFDPKAGARGGPAWVVTTCPHCGARHVHEAGQEPQTRLGIVPAPCGEGHYRLIGVRREGVAK